MSSERLNQSFFGQVPLVSFDGPPPRDIGESDDTARRASGAADPIGVPVAPTPRPGFGSNFCVTPPHREVTPIAVSAGYLFLASAALIATAIIGIFFGAGFFSLASFQSPAISSSSAQNLVPATQSMTSGLPPSADNNDGSPKDGPGSIVISSGVSPPGHSDPSSVSILSSSSVKDGRAPQRDNGAPQNHAAIAAAVEPLEGVRYDTSSHHDAKGESQLEREDVSAASSGPAGAAALTSSPSYLSAAEISELLAQGDARLQSGDVTSARLFYERAADAGDGRGAMRLGATFDPAFLQRAGLRNVQGDAAQAQSWYSRALDLHSARGTRQLDSIEPK